MLDDATDELVDISAAKGVFRYPSSLQDFRTLKVFVEENWLMLVAAGDSLHLWVHCVQVPAK